MTYPDPALADGKLRIIRKQRQIGGVFDAVGRRFGVNPWLLRVPAALLIGGGMYVAPLSLLRLPLIIAYIVAYFAIPKISVDQPRKPSLAGQLATVVLMAGPYVPVGLMALNAEPTSGTRSLQTAGQQDPFWADPLTEALATVSTIVGKKPVTAAAPGLDACPAGQLSDEMVFTWDTAIAADRRGEVAAAFTEALAAAGFQQADRASAPEPAGLYLVGPDGYWVTLNAGTTTTVAHMYGPCAPE